MVEHIARPVYYLEIHLLYGSLVWFAAWVLTSPGIGSATRKYWLWVATSLNFMLPVGAVLDESFTAHLGWASPLGVVGEAGLRIAGHAAVVGAVWLVGVILMSIRLYLRLRDDGGGSQDPQSVGRPAPTLFVDGVPVTFARAGSGPVVEGVLHPHISLPDGIDQLLTKSELNAVLLHEVTHARRRDNLIWLMHELSLCLLWFHPLLWITGSRLALYRELSCDEFVIRKAHGGELVSALVKLAKPEGELLLQASASSFMGHRLARLSDDHSHPAPVADMLLTAFFGTVILWSVLGTVAHTACCFRH
jgi:beta-lactamase regulating signal transducer with metallopeptidase domain